jgi:hypothetical protein
VAWRRWRERWATVPLAPKEYAMRRRQTGGWKRTIRSAGGSLSCGCGLPDAEHEQRAVDILKQHGAEDVHVHTLPGEAGKRTDGVSHDLSFMNALGM